MTKTYTLGKDERLKSRKLIDELFRSALRFSNGPFRVSYALRDTEEPLQYGIGVGTRNFKKAVDRNRIKRLAREAWRLSNSQLKSNLLQQKRSLIVFVNYTGKDMPDYATVLAGTEKVVTSLLRISQGKKP